MRQPTSSRISASSSRGSPSASRNSPPPSGAARSGRRPSMSDTPNLGLTYLEAAQAQKHVTVNEALRRLDALVQIAVLDRNLSAPPALPADGARYLVAAAPTGAWSGHAGEVAAFQDGAWAFCAPQPGWIAYVADEQRLLVRGAGAW